MNDLRNWPGYWITGWKVNRDVSWFRTLIPVVIGLGVAAAVLAPVLF